MLLGRAFVNIWGLFTGLWAFVASSAGGSSFGCVDWKRLGSVKSLLLDCDGVLWRGNEPIPGSIESLIYLRLNHPEIKLLFITNNSAKTRAEYVAKFSSLGFHSVSEEDILTSGYVTATYANKLGVNKVFMIGNDALEKELTLQGIEVLKAEESEGVTISEREFDEYRIDQSVQAVVVGWDRNFSYKKLCLASLYLQGSETLGRKLPPLFLVTNMDPADRTPSGRLLPVTGSIAEAIRTSLSFPISAERESSWPSGELVSCGKPSAIIVEQVLSALGCRREDTLMVGDRLDTDIEFANRAGFKSCCVLTGCTDRQQVEKAIDLKAEAPFRVPTVTADTFAELVEGLFPLHKSSLR